MRAAGEFISPFFFCFAIIWPGLAKKKAKWILAGVIALYVIFTGVGNINPEFTGERTLG